MAEGWVLFQKKGTSNKQSGATEVYLKAFVDLRIGYSAAIGVTMAIVMGVFGALYFRFFGLSDMQDKVG